MNAEVIAAVEVAEMICTHVLAWPCVECRAKADEIVQVVLRQFDGSEP